MSPPAEPAAAGLRVVMVEDDDFFRRLIVEALKARGFEVTEGRTTADAQRLLAEVRPAALVLDGLLPDGNSIPFLQRLRAQGDQTPVLFTSAFYLRDRQAAAQLRSLPAVVTLQKPVQAPQLVQALENLLGLGEPKVTPRSLPRISTDARTPTGPHAAVRAPPRVTPSQGTPAVARPPAADAEARVAALTQEFGGVLGSKVADLRAAATAALGAPQDAKRMEAAIRVAHSLRGTAGSFGYQGVSARAGEVEELLRDVLDNPSLAGSLRSSLEKILAEAGQLAARKA